MKNAHFPLVCMAVVLSALIVSGFGPKDRLTWLLEVGPVIVAVPLLVLTYERFPLSRLAYLLIALHALVLILGGHYTYAEVPLGFWVGDMFGFERNHYDRLGHFFQGFVPAIVARELLVRRSPLAGSRWMPFLVVCFCLAFSAFYELLEWWSALALGAGADDFLGTQGDVWDTQWDMFLALSGATVAVVTLSRTHDRSLAKLSG